MTWWRVEVESFVGATSPPIDTEILSDAAAATEVIVAAAIVEADGAARLALEIDKDSATEAAAAAERFLARFLHHVEPARAADDLAAVQRLIVLPALDVADVARSNFLLRRLDPS